MDSLHLLVRHFCSRNTGPSFRQIFFKFRDVKKCCDVPQRLTNFAMSRSKVTQKNGGSKSHFWLFWLCKRDPFRSVSSDLTSRQALQNDVRRNFAICSHRYKKKIYDRVGIFTDDTFICLRSEEEMESLAIFVRATQAPVFVQSFSDFAT